LIPYFYSRENKKLSTATALITFFVAGIILTSTIPKAGPNDYAVAYLTIPPTFRSLETATKDWINIYYKTSLGKKKRYCSEKFDIIKESLKSREFKELNVTIQCYNPTKSL